MSRANAAIVRIVAGFLASGLACAQAQAVTAAPANLPGCYQLTLTRALPARSVAFFVELSTLPSADGRDAYVVLENRSTGFARVFRHAHWSADGAHALALALVLSDGAESWSAALHGTPRGLGGTAIYSGDGDSPGRRWRAVAIRYTCRR